MEDLKIGDIVPLEVPPKYIPDQHYWEGFEACFEMVIKLLEINDEKSLFTVHNFIFDLKAQLLENYYAFKLEKYYGFKKDGQKTV